MREQNENFGASHSLKTFAKLASSGQSIAQSSFELIDSAQIEIIWMEFLLRDDEFGLMKLALLRKKAREGIRVHLHVDAFHFFADWALVRHLMDEGIQVTIFNELTLAAWTKASIRNHNKALIIDGRVFKTGDSNTGNEYVQWGEGRRMQSIDIVIEGPVVQEVRKYAFEVINSPLSKVPDIQTASAEEVEAQDRHVAKISKVTQAVFDSLFIQLDVVKQLTRPSHFLVTEQSVQAASDRLWQAESRFRGNSFSNGHGCIIDSVRFIADPPLRKVTEGITSSITDFIASAKRRLTIVSPYLILTPAIKDALVSAVRNGVKIRIYTNSMRSTDNFTTQLAYEYRIEEIPRLGHIDVYEYEAEDTLHAKFILRDNDEVMIMTYNLDWRSESKNLETALQFRSLDIQRDLEGWLLMHVDKFVCVSADGHLRKDPLKAVSSTDKIKRLIIKAIEKQL